MSRIISIYKIRLLFLLLFSAQVNCESLRSEGLEFVSAEKAGTFSIVDTYFSRFLAQGTTLSILQTSNDRLWVSNYDGIFKARGKSIRHHNELFGTGTGFSQIRIRSIIEAWDGQVVAVTDANDILLYDESHGYFEEPLWLSTVAPNNGHVSEVFFSSNHDLWIGFTDGNLARVSKDGAVDLENRFAADNGITDFYEDHINNSLIVASRSKISLIDFNNNGFEIFDIAKKCATKSFIQEVASMPTGDVWIGTSGGGLLSFSPHTNDCIQIDSGIVTEKDFRRATIHDLTYDKNTESYIVSSDQGIFVFKADSSVQNFTTSNSKLSNNEVISLSPDNSGGYWVGTYNGINKLAISPFELFDRQQHDGLHSVMGFESVGKTQIAVATYSGLLLKDMDSMNFSRFQDAFPDIPMYGERIMSTLVSKDRIFVGYRNYGFEVLDVRKSIASRWNTETLDSLISNSISSFLETKSGDILVGTYGGGLTIYREHGVSETFSSSDSSNYLQDDRILMLYESSDGTVWVGTETGLQTFDLNQNIFRDAFFESETSKRADPPLIWSMAESIDFLWFGSLHHGLFKLSKSDYFHDFAAGKLQQVPISHSLQTMTVYAIEVGFGNEIWFSTNKGIARLASDGSFSNFGHTYGLQETEFELGSSHKDGNGLIYFGGNHGYNRFDPEAVFSVKKPSEIVLNKIILDGNGSNTYLSTSSIESILLNHEDLFITFEFSALDYADPESTRYRHKLIGFDTDWVDIGSRGSATYTSLPPGEYVFRVQAVNSAGIWNYDGLTIGLEVMPAPWRTWWAYTLYLTAALAALAWASRYQRNNVLRDQQLVHAQEMQRSADRFADDLQDQIEFQTKLSNSMHYYNKQLLYWTKFCTDTTVEYESADTVLAHERIRFRLDVLELAQDSLYYRGEQLYAQLPSFVSSLVDKLCSNHPEVGSRLISINDVKSDLVPAARAIPIAIIFAELFDNSVKHALPGKSASCFVRFSLTITPDMSSSSDRYQLVYQDDGDGIPPGLSFESPESAGFAIIRHAAALLGGEIEISDEDRRLVSASFDLPW